MVFIIFMIVVIVAAMRKGLLFMLTVLFNLAVSIYIAIASVPQILTFSPFLARSPYYAAGLLLLLTAAVFAGLHGLARRLFLSGDTGYFGILLDRAGSAAVGFVTGYVLWGFLLLILSMLHWTQNPIIKETITGPSAEEFARISMTDVCQYVITASLDAPEIPVEEKIRRLQQGPEEAPPVPTP